MKKFIVLLAVLMIGVSSFAQRTISDTVYGAESVSFTTMEGASLVQALFTALGDSTAGTATLYGSLDGSSWVFLNYVGGTLGVASPKASITGADLNQITVASALVASWNVLDDYPYNKLVVTGTAANDTTLVTIKWSK